MEIKNENKGNNEIRRLKPVLIKDIILNKEKPIEPIKNNIITYNTSEYSTMTDSEPEYDDEGNIIEKIKVLRKINKDNKKICMCKYNILSINRTCNADKCYN
jgi:hypothetical protein